MRSSSVARLTSQPWCITNRCVMWNPTVQRVCKSAFSKKKPHEAPHRAQKHTFTESDTKITNSILLYCPTNYNIKIHSEKHQVDRCLRENHVHTYIHHLGCMKQQIWERPRLLEDTWHKEFQGLSHDWSTTVYWRKHELECLLVSPMCWCVMLK